MRLFVKITALMLPLLLLLLPSTLLANSPFWRIKPLFDADRASRKVSIHPLKYKLDPNVLQLNHGLNLNSFDLGDGIAGYLSSQLNSSFIKVMSNRHLGLTESGQYHFNFSIDDIPFCDPEVKAFQQKNGALVMLGELPNVSELPSFYWDTFTDSVEAAKDWLKEKGVEVNSLQDIAKDQCFFVDEQRAVPVWRFNLRINEMAYRFIADKHQVYRFEPGFFQISGKVRAYKSNPNEGTLSTYVVDLTGDGTLTSEYFKTITYGVERASEESHEFIYDVDNQYFGEVNSFAHAALAYEFYKEVGYTWQGPQPLDLHVHRIIGNTTNNALYEPSDSTGTGFPAISIGDGDGNVLQNLTYDADVVGHEFGHHVVYSTLKNISGESLVLHEGLADYFTFAKTNDACLGESICPAKSGACWVQGECLRTADNDLRYDDVNFKRLSAHPQSQVVSGMLWDLNVKEEIPLEEVTNIVYNGVKKFAKNSGYYDLILALMLADKDLYDGKYACTIFDAAVERGFGDVIEGISCDSPSDWGVPSGSNLGGAGSTVTSSSEKQKGTLGDTKCGVLTLTKSSRSIPLNIIVFMLLLSPTMVFINYKK